MPLGEVGKVFAAESRFVGSPKYVREGNYTTDLVAQIEVPSTATNVRFNFTGIDLAFSELVEDLDTANGTDDNDIYSITGAPAGFTWWRVQKNLAGGHYSMTAEYFDGSVWTAVAGSGEVYSINIPSFEYIIPNASTTFFRPNDDNPVRAKIDDQYNQFLKIDYTLFSASGTSLGVFTVNRDQCDLRAEGNYVLCDLKNSSAWLPLADGSYYVKAQTDTIPHTGIRHSMAVSQSGNFTIDSELPTVSNFVVETASPLSGIVTASANAADNNAVLNAEFYITAPRASDGACDGNGDKLVQSVVTTPSADGKYRATLNTSSLNGSYCLNLIAEDVAHSNSSPISRLSVDFDNIAPVAPNPLSPIDGINIGKTGFTQTWEQVADAVEYRYQSCNTDPGDLGGACSSVRFTQTFLPGQVKSVGYPVAQGRLWWRLQARDTAGNWSPWGRAFEMTIDYNSPSVPTGLTFKLPSGTDLGCGATTNSFNITADWNNSTDALSGVLNYEYHINYPTLAGIRGDAYITVTQSQYSGVFNAGQGSHVYKVRAQDRAGNWSGWSSTCEIFYDSKAPVIVDEASDDATTGGDIMLRATAEDMQSNIAQITYEFFNDGVSLGALYKGNLAPADGAYDSKIETGYSDVVDLSLLETGIYQVKFCGVDALGTAGDGAMTILPTAEPDECYVRELYVDNTAPWVDPENMLVDIPDLVEGLDPLPTVTVGALDDSDVVTLCIQATFPSGMPVGGCIADDSDTDSWNLTAILADFGIYRLDTSVLEEGTYNVEYYFVDDHGNRSELYTADYTVSNEIPVPVLEANQTIKEYETANFTGSFNDPSCFINELGYCDNWAEMADDAPWRATVDFGDGTPVVVLGDEYFVPGTLVIPSHQYTTPGTYQVRLEVCEYSDTPGEGECGADTVTVVVENNAPVVTVAPLTNTITTAQSVTLNASHTLGNEVVAYSWSCTNGQTATGVNTLVFTNSATGSFTCTVTVTDSDGDTATDSAAITVTAVPQTPTTTTTTHNTGGQVLSAQTAVVAEAEDEKEEDKGEVKGESTCTATSKVVGHLYFDKNGNGSFDDGEEGLMDIEIEMVSKTADGKEKVDATAKSDSKGRWEFNVCTGTFTFRVKADQLPDNVRVVSAALLNVTVANENSEVNSEFRLERSANFFEMYWWLLLLVALGVVGGGAYVVKRSR